MALLERSGSLFRQQTWSRRIDRGARHPGLSCECGHGGGALHVCRHCAHAEVTVQ
jgi:hypothetical protein